MVKEGREYCVLCLTICNLEDIHVTVYNHKCAQKRGESCQPYMFLEKPKRQRFISKLQNIVAALNTPHNSQTKHPTTTTATFPVK